MARLFSARTVLLGIAAGVAYGAIKNKQAVKGMLGGGSSAPEPYAPPGPAPAPVPNNADVAGPPQNTATAVPAPDPLTHDPDGGIDEQAEEDAAAAEAANIGGPAPDYPSEEDATEPAAEELRPLEEAGEGVSEGEELAEADLADNAESAAGDPIEGERAIDDAIEAQDEPASGESLEATEQMPLDDAPPPSGDPVADVPPPETPAAEKSSAVWSDDQPTVEQDAVSEDDRPADGTT